VRQLGAPECRHKVARVSACPILPDGQALFKVRPGFGLPRRTEGADHCRLRWRGQVPEEIRHDPSFAVYVFPFGKPQPSDATRHITTFSTVWTNVKNACGIKGRWHDNRHTFITDLAERGEAADGTIMDLAGHVSRRMLKHYSHIGMEAKRRAVDSLAKKPAGVVVPTPEQMSNETAKVSAKVELLN
jgi:hypothetical protein